MLRNTEHARRQGGGQAILEAGWGREPERGPVRSDERVSPEAETALTLPASERDHPLTRDRYQRHRPHALDSKTGGCASSVTVSYPVPSAGVSRDTRWLPSHRGLDPDEDQKPFVADRLVATVYNQARRTRMPPIRRRPGRLFSISQQMAASSGGNRSASQTSTRPFRVIPGSLRSSPYPHASPARSGREEVSLVWNSRGIADGDSASGIQARDRARLRRRHVTWPRREGRARPRSSGRPGSVIRARSEVPLFKLCRGFDAERKAADGINGRSPSTGGLEASAGSGELTAWPTGWGFRAQHSPRPPASWACGIARSGRIASGPGRRGTSSLLRGKIALRRGAGTRRLPPDDGSS